MSVKISLDSSLCVRYASKFSGCDSCQKACPIEVIDINESRVDIDAFSCIGCGVCAGACPTEAIRVSETEIYEKVFELISSKESVIGCRYNFFCLAAINGEYLATMALVNDIVLDVGFCKECEIKEECYDRILNNVSEADYILQALGVNAKIELKDLKKVSDISKERRELFSSFAFGKYADKEAQNGSFKREKIPPKRRRLFLAVLKQLGIEGSSKLLESKYLGFFSDKSIDDSCDNCSVCYRVCPTDALSFGSTGEILFDAAFCVRCALCHDVCEKESVKMEEFFDFESVTAKEPKVLKRFKMAICDECSNPFASISGERVCRRCRIEEEEAKTLWGL